MTTKDLQHEALEGLRAFLSDPDAEFRDGQWESIHALIEGSGRRLVVQRTGWGKSIVYFLATRLLRDRGRGATLIISPLLALMRNQIAMAERFGLRAATVNSTNPDDWADVRDALLRDEMDVLFVSPERLANSSFLEGTLLPVADHLGLFVVDEAHCISDWGHDFRPDYQRIRGILRSLPANVPVLATTATANDRVVEDVCRQLGEGAATPQRGPLARPSLCLENLTLPTRVERYAWLAARLPQMPGSGIVYVLTRRDADRLSAWLRAQGIDAHAYMGGGRGTGGADENAVLEQKLLDNEVKVLVATTALGMGFDKPDLASVVHFQRPGSVIHYYQQVGRAGRALESAYGIMLSGSEDEDITDFFIESAFAPEKHVRMLLAALEAAPQGLSVPRLEAVLNLGPQQIRKVLRLLAVESPAPITKVGTAWRRTPVAYDVDHERVARLVDLRRHEQMRMRDYLAHEGCLMAFLQGELNDAPAHVKDCGRCARCRGDTLLAGAIPESLIDAAAAFLDHGDRVIEPRASWIPAKDVLLEAHGWRGAIALELQAEPGRSLCQWSDPGMGARVRRARQTDGRFDDVLVAASAALIGERWNPTPPPTWLTAVPSLRHPDLVADFAARLADALGIPFRPLVKKVCETRPQKEMGNSYHQAQNLSGAFSVLAGPQGSGSMRGPVLLVDDLVDSRWTSTVIAALLREAGSGPVHPYTLACSARS